MTTIVVDPQVELFFSLEGFLVRDGVITRTVLRGKLENALFAYLEEHEAFLDEPWDELCPGRGCHRSLSVDPYDPEKGRFCSNNKCQFFECSVDDLFRNHRFPPRDWNNDGEEIWRELISSETLALCSTHLFQQVVGEYLPRVLGRLCGGKVRMLRAIETSGFAIRGPWSIYRTHGLYEKRGPLWYLIWPTREDISERLDQLP